MIFQNLNYEIKIVKNGFDLAGSDCNWIRCQKNRRESV